MNPHERSGQRCTVATRLLAPTEDNPSILDRLQIECPLSGHEHSGAQCCTCERFLGWRVSPTAEPVVVCWLPCASCGSRRAHGPEMAGTVFCDECRERGIACDDDEFGGGD